MISRTGPRVISRPEISPATLLSLALAAILLAGCKSTEPEVVPETPIPERISGRASGEVTGVLMWTLPASLGVLAASTSAARLLAAREPTPSS